MNKIIFNHWNEEKQNLHFAKLNNVYPKNREIWYTKTGINIGCEENGKKNFLRPVLVLKKVGNLFFVASLTTKGKDNHYFYHKINAKNFNYQNKKHADTSYIILSQVRVMDKKRFTENIGFVAKKEFAHIQEKLKTILF